MIDLPDEIKAHYLAMRELPDGRIVGIHRLLFHWTMHVDIGWYGYEDRYCYETSELAIEAMSRWDGTGDPVGWHKHIGSGRRRHLPTGIIWHESEPVPEAVRNWRP